MAERSFAQEVKQLELGAGQEFRGEGILAVTKALLEAGVGYVGGYQGSPISHLMDVLADARPTLDRLGVHFESSASEASAAAMLAASVMYPIRGAVTWKSTAGTNVASDALSNLSSGGVKGGALVILGEDYGEGSSIMQERSHAYAMKSQMWLLDPRPNLPAIVKAVKDGFALSEASNTPVMLELRVRACHVHGRFTCADNVPPPFTLREAMDNPARDLSRIVLPPAAYKQEHEKVEQRWPAAVEFIQAHGLNEFVPSSSRWGAHERVGIIVQGGMYNGVLRALQQLGLADIWGESAIPLYVMNVAYPVIDDEVSRFCAGKDAAIVVEEGQPNFIEQNIATVLRQRDIQTKLLGKGLLPLAGEYTNAVLGKALRGFLAEFAPGALTDSGRAPNRPTALPDDLRTSLDGVVPQRPAGFCTGCPERPIFSAMKLTMAELGDHHVASDIGCHLFSILPPFNLGATTMGYGLAGASAAAFNVPKGPDGAGKRTIAVMGDGGFWHNGLVSSIGNAVFNKSDNVTLIVDNHYAAATGGQDILSSRADNADRSTQHPIEAALRGVGVKWVRRIDRTYDVGRMRALLKEALTTTAKGPKVIVASSECMLNKQRRVKPATAKAIKAGRRVVRERFGVDEDLCTGDHACIRLSGCPSLSMKHTDDPLKNDPVAAIDESCVGCGHCGEVAEAAVLCPSFYRADMLENPTAWDRFAARVRGAAIGWLQRRRDDSRMRQGRVPA